MSPIALLARRHLATEGADRFDADSAPGGTASHDLACLLGADDASALPPEVATVSRAPLETTPQMHEWTSALDYHRFPSRSRDAHVAITVHARRFGPGLFGPGRGSIAAGARERAPRRLPPQAHRCPPPRPHRRDPPTHPEPPSRHGLNHRWPSL